MKFLTSLTIVMTLMFADAKPGSYNELAGTHALVVPPSMVKRQASCASQCVGKLNRWGTEGVSACAKGDTACICSASQWFTSGCIACLVQVSSADELTRYYQGCNVIPESITSTSSCSSLCQKYTPQFERISACGQDDGCICNAYYDIDIGCINCRMVAEGQNQRGNAADFINQCQARYPIPSGISSVSGSSRDQQITTSATATQPAGLQRSSSLPPSPTPSPSSTMLVPAIPRPSTTTSAFFTAAVSSSTGSGAVPTGIVPRGAIGGALVGIIVAHIV